MVRVKVCGITNLEDALVAAASGADALGFNFWPGSPRYIVPVRAVEIIAQLPPFVAAVGVFVNEERPKLERLARQTGIAAVQLHGDESPDEVAALAASGLVVLKAVRVGRGFLPQQLRAYRGVAAFLLDADVKGQRGGTGQTFDWRRARAAGRYGRLVLSGGLTPENVAEAIAAVQPYGVDVCTGVEHKPGLKDHTRLRAFLERAKSVPCG
ncbi:MAG: phosphoribosylanthranilate isomerase [Acidobacteria bacterium]|nr:phosphoribosylanthranilate isomerase [Acidobacteriota bacterium]